MERLAELESLTDDAKVANWFIQGGPQKPVMNGVVTHISRVKYPQENPCIRPFINVTTPFIASRRPSCRENGGTVPLRWREPSWPLLFS